MKISAVEKYFLSFLAIIVLITIGLYGLYIWPTADDYCNLIQAKGHDTVFKYASSLYFNWTGRFLSNYLIGLAVQKVGIDNFRFVSCILGLVMVVSTAYLVKSIFKKISIFSSVLLCSSILAFWALSNRQFPFGEVVYWVTGGLVYTISLFFGALFLYYLEADKIKLSVLTLVVGFLLGISLENLSFAISGYVALRCLFLLQQGKKSEIRKVLWLFLPFVIGSFFLFLAPGNFVRAKYSDSSFKMNASFLVKNFFDIISLYKSLTKSYIMRVSYIPTLMGLLVFPLYFFKKDSVKVVVENEYFQKSLCFLVGAYSSVIPMVLVSEFAAPRTGFVFFVFMSFAVISFGAFLFSLLKSRGYLLQQFWSHLLSLGCIVLFGIYLYHFSKNFITSKNFYADAHRREKEILSNPSIDVVTRRIELPVGRYIHFNDIVADKDNWINACVAQFYERKTIRLDH